MKATTPSPSKPGRWRETKRNGVPCLISPNGRVFYGTAAEVREAALTPTARRRLAEMLRSERCASDSPAERKATAARLAEAAKELKKGATAKA